MELVEKYGFIEMILEKLQKFDLTVPIYNALFEVVSRLVLIFVISVLLQCYLVFPFNWRSILLLSFKLSLPLHSPYCCIYIFVSSCIFSIHVIYLPFSGHVTIKCF